MFTQHLSDEEAKYEEKMVELLKGSFNPKEIKYFCVQVETCPKSKAIHLQGFVSFIKDTQAYEMLEHFEVFEKSTSIDKAKGSAKQNKKYCSKEGGRFFTELGILPSPGERTDLKEIANKITAGCSMELIAKEHPGDFFRYHSGFIKMQNLLVHPVDMLDKKVFLYIWGKPGIGKSFCVNKSLSPAIRFRVPVAEKKEKIWFDGYNQQPVIIFDDFDTGEAQIPLLLKVTDTYCNQFPVKGGFISINSPVVIIISNNSFSGHYPDSSALARRLTKEIHLEGKIGTPQNRKALDELYTFIKEEIHPLVGDKNIDSFSLPSD